MALIDAYRMLRFGRPIVVVSGLPRSGTSMAMGMLSAGGLEVVEDHVRTPDESNPRGYFELERVMALDKPGDKSWLASARGKAIKIVSVLLPHLPDTNNYRVVFMHRPLDEIVASQNQMLAARSFDAAQGGVLDDDTVARRYRTHLDDVRRILTTRRAFAVLDVNHGDVLSHPLEQAERIALFAGGSLDIASMAASVDPALYRNRTARPAHVE